MQKFKGGWERIVNGKLSLMVQEKQNRWVNKDPINLTGD